LIEFFASRLFTGAVAIILFPVLMNMGLDFVFLGVPGLMARGVNTTVEIILNYILSKFVVFRRSNNTGSKP
jgi:putative flippase GtrA